MSVLPSHIASIAPRDNVTAIADPRNSRFQIKGANLRNLRGLWVEKEREVLESEREREREREGGKG